MIERAAERLGLYVDIRYSENECSVIDAVGSVNKTLTLLDDNSFTRAMLENLNNDLVSYLSKIERIEEFEDKLLVVSSEAGKAGSGSSIHEAYAACCTALVLKSAGAVHGNLIANTRSTKSRHKVFGFDEIIPCTPDGETAELNAITAMCGINAPNLETLREKLSVYIERWDTAQRRALAAEDVKNTLLALPEFNREWQSLEYINAGAYGFIYRAVSALDGKEYALKVMNVGSDMERFCRAKRESSNASQFFMNDYIVKTFDDGKVIAGSDRYIWISMELLEPIPCEISDERTVAMIARDVCCALEEIHKNGGMAHRDVKPGNILRGKDNWKLCDFGVSKEVQGRELATVIGTSEYMAPELLKAVASNTDKVSYNNSVDMYALGITMYTLLNRGTAPFLSAPPYIPTALEQKNANTRRIQGEPLPKAINCSERLMKIINKACNPNPAERYQSISKMYDALENYLDD